MNYLGPMHIDGPYASKRDCRRELREDAIDDLACYLMTDSGELYDLLCEGLPGDKGTETLAVLLADYNKKPDATLAFQIIAALVSCLENMTMELATKRVDTINYDGPEAA